MKYIKRSLIFGFIAALFLINRGHGSEAPALHFMQASGASRPPIGHVAFCKAYPAHCARKPHQDKRMELTQPRWDELIRINHLVNQSVLPKSDEELYALPEVWIFPGRYGDCEDYVLLKRQYLLEAGWPMGSLLITVVREADGKGHAVLTVLTDRGDFILDNQEAHIRLWSQTPYTYLKRQAAWNPAKWQMIEDRREGVVTRTGSTQ